MVADPGVWTDVYVIVNAQLGGNAVTTPVHAVSIVKRGVSAVLESSSRAAVEVALSVSNRSGMTLRVSHIPNDYPSTGLLDMRQVTISALFEFGVGVPLRRVSGVAQLTRSLASVNPI
jgi:hypothetical protein